jgi:hypothetical protein
LSNSRQCLILFIRVMKHYLKSLVLVLVLAALAASLSCRSPVEESEGPDTAAIIDQLYILESNPAFVSEATRLLESYGFEVDLWQGFDITVDFYRKLPSLGYKFIIFRVHSGILLSLEEEGVKPLPTTYLFTAENYTTTRYITEQLTDKVSNAVMVEDYPLVFAVNSEFIRDIEGEFDNTVILAMGCESYSYDDMPAVFVEKGASAYVGWSYVVSLEYVDEVTLDLIGNLCTANLTLSQAITQTMDAHGRDPYFDAFLKYYPAESGDKTVKELISQ